MLQELQRFDEARTDFERALSIDPDFANAHYDLATLCLRLGDFERGFREYEWRWKVPNLKLFAGSFTGQPWLGREDLSGKTIVLFADQGLGDTIQFCRYARLAAAAGARVILQVQKGLVALLSGMAGVEQVIATGEPVPEHDFHAALCSLPLAFGTTLETIPGEIAYLDCAAGPARPLAQPSWASAGPKIGLNWAGNQNYQGDAERSILLPPLLPLLKNAGVNFVGPAERPARRRRRSAARPSADPLHRRPDHAVRGHGRGHRADGRGDLERHRHGASRRRARQADVDPAAASA